MSLSFVLCLPLRIRRGSSCWSTGDVSSDSTQLTFRLDTSGGTHRRRREKVLLSVEIVLSFFPVRCLLCTASTRSLYRKQENQAVADQKARHRSQTGSPSRPTSKLLSQTSLRSHEVRLHLSNERLSRTWPQIW